MSYPGIGIDLGTTNSVVAIVKPGDDRPTIIQSLGERLVPSIVGFTEDNERIVGHAAKAEKLNFERNFYGIKRIIGRDFNEKEIETDIKNWPFKVKKDDKNGCTLEYKAQNKTFELKPEEVSGAVLSHLKEAAAIFLAHTGQVPKDAVITVPAYFNDKQRRATIQAAKIAGLNVLRIINEPTAAALAYGTMNPRYAGEKDKNLLVFDLGGGTFDVSIVTLDEGVYQVKASKGDMHLGGDDFDNLIVNWIVEKFKKEDPKGLDLSKDKLTYLYLLEKSRDLKHFLSFKENVTMTLENIGGKPTFKIEMSRSEFNGLIKPHVQKCIDIVKETMALANLQTENIDNVLLVGGSTKSPVFSQVLEKMFKKPPIIENPDEIVALGAACAAKNLSAVGDKDGNAITLIDKTAHALGVAVNGTNMSVLLDAQRSIPCSETGDYGTVGPFQKEVLISVYQGPNQLVKDNWKIAEARFSGWIPQISQVKILISFKLDENSVLQVSAECPDEGVEKATLLTVELNNSEINANEMEEFIKKNQTFEEKKAMKDSLNNIKNKMNRMSLNPKNLESESYKEMERFMEKSKEGKVNLQECQEMEKKTSIEDMEFDENTFFDLN